MLVELGVLLGVALLSPEVLEDEPPELSDELVSDAVEVDDEDADFELPRLSVL